MVNRDELQLKVVGLLLPLTKKPAMFEALKDFDITIEWNDEKDSAEISFLDKGDLRKFVKGVY